MRKRRAVPEMQSHKKSSHSIYKSRRSALFINLAAFSLGYFLPMPPSDKKFLLLFNSDRQTNATGPCITRQIKKLKVRFRSSLDNTLLKPEPRRDVYGGRSLKISPHVDNCQQGVSLHEYVQSDLKCFECFGACTELPDVQNLIHRNNSLFFF